MGIKEEFEKLTEIAEILNRNGGGYYKERTNDYHHCNLYFDKFLNGAWYAFQEHQKKIDAIVSIVREADLSDGNSSVAIVHDEIMELLK